MSKQAMKSAIEIELARYDDFAKQTKLGEIMWNRQRPNVVARIDEYFSNDDKWFSENHPAGFEKAQSAVVLAKFIPVGLGDMLNNQAAKK